VITGRAAMFENIDSLRSTYTAQLTPANGKSGYNYFNFYGANLERKYGSGTDPATGLATYLEKFKARASWRLEAWGFNTVGWESNKLFFEKPTLPFVFPLKLHSYYSGPQIASAGGHSIYDPFDSSFSTAVTSAVTSGIPNYCVTSNYLIGYYIDNELPWGIIDTTSYKDYYAIPVNTLALSYDHAAKKEFANDLHAKYGTIANLNSSWGTSIASWTGLENSFTGLPSTATSGLKADLSAFLKRFATQYFSVVSKALKNRDPNHLYLGCRFAYTERPTEVLEACEAYSDAVSANIYAYQLNTEQRNFITSTTKPIIISEFHFGSTDRGPFWSGLVDAGNEASRGPDYTAYVTDLARQYNVVGCAWYPYTDQPTAGEPSDTENGHVGFVSVADIPYSDFIGVVRTTNLSLTKMHNGK
jgi:hypothetical protein